MKTRQTARLLRSLLLAVQNQANEESSQFDWDPITFGFTVPIAILATLFALLTIFQAIAAAGKGRRRSNHLAIGTWSARTTRKWSWHEMSFQFTARTPVLRADIIPMHPRPPFIWTHNPFSATWIGFLDQIGLGQSVVIEDSLRETAADYLPDDLLAVPAYSEVGFIVASLAAAGASWKVGAESLYPVITGHDFQFDFRQHPNLGTVGAYSKYTNTSPRSPSVEALNEAILHGHGRVTVSHLFSTVMSDPLYSHYRPVTDVFTRLRIPEDINRRRNHTEDCQPGKSLCKAVDLFSRKDNHGIIWLFIATTPDYLPSIFPSLHLRTPKALTALSLSSKSWSSPKHGRLFSLINERAVPDILKNGDAIWIEPDYPPSFDGFQMYAISILALPAGPLQDHIGKSSSQHRIERSTSIKIKWLDEERLCGFRVVLLACFELLRGTEGFMLWFNALHREKQKYFRFLVLLQLQQVDQWLDRVDTTVIWCRSITLCHITMAILDAEEAINDDAFGYPLPSARGLDSDGNETPLVYSQENVFIRHLKTLEILDRLIDEFQLKTFVPNKLDSFWILGKRIREHSEEERRLAKEYTKTVKRYSKQLACLAGLSADDRGSVISRYSSIETLLQSLSRVVSHLVAADLMNEAEGSSIDDGEGEDRDSDEDYMEEKLPNSPSVAADGPDNGGRMDLGENSPRESPGEDPVQQAPRPVETEKEHQDKSTGRNKQAPSIDTIDDMLVWRCILLSMLFQTAPDNTELLRSGLWTHVDPII